jgi:hypothetical protein
LCWGWIDYRIPSRLLVFRNENHFVQDPKNSLKWHEEVLGWITKWTSHPHGAEDAVEEGEIKGGFVMQGMD